MNDNRVQIRNLEKDLSTAMDRVAVMIVDLEAARKNIARLLRSVGSVSTCRGCSQSIVWVKHNSGRSAPYDADGTPHFATCPQADQFRRKAQHASVAGAREA